MAMNCTPEALGTGWTTIQNRFDLNRGVDVFVPVKKACLVLCFIPFHSAKIYIMQ